MGSWLILVCLPLVASQAVSFFRPDNVTRVTGQVLCGSTPAAFLTVEWWEDRGQRIDVLLGSTRIDGRGSFQIETNRPAPAKSYLFIKNNCGSQREQSSRFEVKILSPFNMQIQLQNNNNGNGPNQVSGTVFSGSSVVPNTIIEWWADRGSQADALLGLTQSDAKGSFNVFRTNTNDARSSCGGNGQIVRFSVNPQQPFNMQLQLQTNTSPQNPSQVSIEGNLKRLRSFAKYSHILQPQRKRRVYGDANKGEENDAYEVRYRTVTSTQAADGDSIEDRVPHLSLPRGSHVRDFAKGDCVSNDASGQSLTSRGDANGTTEEKSFQPVTEANGNLKVSTGDQNCGNTVATALNNESPVIPPLSNFPAGDHADTDDDNISYDDESVKSDDGHNHDSHESEAVVLPNVDTAVSTATVQLEINDDFQDESVSANSAAEEESGDVKLVGDFLRKPSATRERQNTSLSTIPEDRETLFYVSPMKEPDHSCVVGNNIVPVDAAPEASQPKEERRVRVRVPRRRWLDCCTIL